MLETIRDVVAVVGGLAGIIGGSAGMIARYRAPKLDVSYTDFIGVVISKERTTPKLHLPLCLSNMSNKPGVITHVSLHAQPVNGGERHKFEWDLFWIDDAEGGKRSPEKQPVPIPIPALSGTERNIQFGCSNTVTWRPDLYQFELEIRAGRGRKSKQMSSFYFRLSRSRCDSWYEGPRLQIPGVDQIPIYSSVDLVPELGA